MLIENNLIHIESNVSSSESKQDDKKSKIL